MKPSTSDSVIASKNYSLFFMMVLFLFGGSAFAVPKVYQKPSAFVQSTLGAMPAPKALRFTGAQKKQIRRILGGDYKTTSIRYWTRNGKTAYILEEIGKTEDITTGIAVKNSRIESVKVLVYRETHGSEVARRAFTRQFRGVTLRANTQLSKNPRNIAGATLSVRALTKLSRLALYLDTLK